VLRPLLGFGIYNFTYKKKKNLPNEHFFFFFFFQIDFLSVKSTFRPFKRNPKQALNIKCFVCSFLTLQSIDVFSYKSWLGILKIFQWINILLSLNVNPYFLKLQYLKEAGWADGGRLIACTQPRRLAVQVSFSLCYCFKCYLIIHKNNLFTSFN
jgi:hypothetical protein